MLNEKYVNFEMGYRWPSWGYLFHFLIHFKLKVTIIIWCRGQPCCRLGAPGVRCIHFGLFCFVFLWRCGPTRAMASSFLRFLDHTQRRITVGRTPLYEWSARRRDLYLTTHNTHNRQTSMPPVGFEPTISAGERPQTYALDRAATGTGRIHLGILT